MFNIHSTKRKQGLARLLTVMINTSGKNFVLLQCPIGVKDSNELRSLLLDKIENLDTNILVVNSMC